MIELIELILLGVVCGFFCAHIAEAKRLNAGLWFFGGFLFSIIALIAIVGMPEKRNG